MTGLPPGPDRCRDCRISPHGPPRAPRAAAGRVAERAAPTSWIPKIWRAQLFRWGSSRYKHTAGAYNVQGGRRPQTRGTQADEQKNSFDFGIRRLVVLHELRCPGRGRLRPWRTSWPGWTLLRQRRRGRGCARWRGRCRCAGRSGLRSRPSLASWTAALLGLLRPPPDWHL